MFHPFLSEQLIIDEIFTLEQIDDLLHDIPIILPIKEPFPELSL
jgi:hypothetical protein